VDLLPAGRTTLASSDWGAVTINGGNTNAATDKGIDVTSLPCKRRLFSLLDQQEIGQVDFRQYLLGLALVNKSVASEVIGLAFKIFDFDGDGRIRLDDLRDVLRRAFPTLTPQQIQQTLQQLDKSGKGMISEEEFSAFALSDARYTASFSSTFLPVSPPTPISKPVSGS